LEISEQLAGRLAGQPGKKELRSFLRQHAEGIVRSKSKLQNLESNLLSILTQLADHWKSLPQLFTVSYILGGYEAISPEPELSFLSEPLKNFSAENSIAWAFPKTQGPNPQMDYYSQAENLSQKSERVPPENLLAIVIPGLGFDRRGYRLGRGRAYFDRFLPMAPNAIKIGIAWQDQLIKEIPVENHDIPMDVIVTDNEILKINPRLLSQKG
jgi:5,10-methenyltetrahydrofolate synthetase